MSFRRQQSGSTVLIVVIALLTVTAVTLGTWFFLRNTELRDEEEPLLSEVIRGPYEHVVLEQGEVESTNNVEIRCEVKARGGGGTSTTILDVVPEGTRVNAGDWLVSLDSSSLEEEGGRQRIVVNTSEAMMIQAEADFKTAEIAKTEYMKGTFVQEEKMILNEIYVAEDALKKAQLELKSAERLLAKGLLTELQLEAQQFSVAKAQNDLDAGNTKLTVLRDYTKRKMLTQLDSDVKAAEVRWRNERDSHAEELRQLEEIQEQVAKCTITAPQQGVVVHANIRSARSNEFIVEPGAPVRERQVIIRLPDTNNMQVKAKINEARINLVQPGHPVSIRIDALGDRTLSGEVVKVNQYAEPGHWWRSTSKEYATYIQILDPPDNILAGLTAEVRIHVDSSNDTLQVPIQAIYEHAGKTYCLIWDDDDWKTFPIVITSTNDKTVAIDEQRSETLKVGDFVVANARRHAGKFKLPDPTRLATNEQAAGNSTVEEVQPDDKDRQDGHRSRSAEDMLGWLDKDRDGKISTTEIDSLPANIRGGLSRADKNADGLIDSAELKLALARMRQTRRPAAAE